MTASSTFERVGGYGAAPAPDARAAAQDTSSVVAAEKASPILSIVVFAWGLPQVKGALNALSAPSIQVPGLHLMVQRVAPVVPAATAEAAVYTFNWLSATGSAICLAAVIGGLLAGTPMTLLVIPVFHALARRRQFTSASGEATYA